MTINELKALILEGGATFKDNKPVIYNSGYQVAILYHRSEYDNTPEEHQALLNAINHGFLTDGGIWHNPDTNKIEVNILTVHTTNKTDALNLAKHFNQKSIFDWSTLDSIYL